jgi:cell division protease FtsH
MYDFEMAKDKVLMGAERRSMMISEEEKKHTAYHEAGHAIVAALTPQSDPVHKVTIIPRGMALGVTMMLPTGDKVDLSKEQAEAKITVAMAGRVADEKFLNMRTAGAANDIDQATELARRMVCEWGMSELGPVSLGKREEQIFLGREIAQHRDYSEQTAIRIDEQIRHIIENGYQRAKKIIDERADAVVRIAETLLEREVLDGAEVKILIDGGELTEWNPPKRPSGDSGQTQQVLRPDGPRSVIGLREGDRPQPA